MPDFSIIVLTYNSPWHKVAKTLDSIFFQSFDSYEIIVADDGSRDNLKSQLLSYFDEKGFPDYRLNLNRENVGTVNNYIFALKVCRGDYIFAISPGDYIYHKNSLKNMYCFMKNHDISASFGIMQAYYTDGGENARFTGFNHPFDINSYRNKNYNKILRNLILYSDNASGASFVFKKDFLEKYLIELKDTVIYEEDIMQVSMALNHEPMVLFDEFFIYYEVNSGVSSKTSPFELLLAKDVENFYKMMLKKYPDNRLLQRRNRLGRLYRINNLYLRTFLRIFVNPGLISYLLNHFMQSASKAYLPKNKVSDAAFLDNTD